MTRMHIELPEDVRAKLAVRAAQAGHHDVETYVAAILTAEANMPSGPQRLHVTDNDDLERLLLSRIDDDPDDIEATPEFWERFDQEVAKRRAKGK